MRPYFTEESKTLVLSVTFKILQSRLLAFVNLRIKNGEYSERGLARILGVSQSQLHNVLKGARALHSELADRLLKKFGVTALELLHDGELSAELEVRSAAQALLTLSEEEAPRRWRRPATRSPRLGSQRTEEAS
jgi:plasmid maintenance system antidote protein VapI